MTPQALRALCEEAVRRGGDVLVQKKSTQRVINFKSRRDIVTDADRASEQVILDYLGQASPGDSVISEESAKREGSTARTWIVDPLDGTTNYTHGLGHFCVTVAVQDGEGMVAGATFDPTVGELFSAARGEGATLNGQPLKVSSCTLLEHAVLSTGGLPPIKPEAVMDVFRTFSNARGLRRFGASALDLAWIAAGRMEGYWEHSIRVWDMAAGVLLVKEAGGTVTGFNGEPIHPFPRGVCAGAPGIQPLLLEVFRKAQQEPT